MDIKEANKIIAEYMGEMPVIITERVGIKIVQYCKYCSLDNLIPVWENMFTVVHYSVINDITNVIARDLVDQNFKTKEGAAIATAMAIKEIK